MAGLIDGTVARGQDAECALVRRSLVRSVCVCLCRLGNWVRYGHVPGYTGARGWPDNAEWG